jgi:hypothetical protein
MGRSKIVKRVPGYMDVKAILRIAYSNQKEDISHFFFTQAIKMKTENISYVYLGRGIARYNIGKVGLACQDWERSVLMGEKNASKYMEQYCK